MIIKKENAKKVVRELIEDEIYVTEAWTLNDDSFDHEFGTEEVIWIGWDGDEEITVEFLAEFDVREDEDLMASIESPAEVDLDHNEFEAYVFPLLEKLDVDKTDGGWRTTLTYALAVEVGI